MDTLRCESRLGVVMRNRALLEQALTHGSHINETGAAAIEGNERMEFLGDAVLGMVIAEDLYASLAAEEEGKLTATRSALVRRETLADTARGLGLGACLRLGRGEEASGGRDKPKNLADVFEAIIGAVYLDQGYDLARALILRLLGPRIQAARAHGTAPNCKALLQEYLQAHNEPLPRYRMVEAVGPDHDQEFTVEVPVHGCPLATGVGRSKKTAEATAACTALAQLRAKEV